MTSYLPPPRRPRSYLPPRAPARRTYSTSGLSWALPGSTVPTTTRATRPSGTVRSVNHVTGEGRDHLLRFRRAAFLALAKSEGLKGDAARRRADVLLTRWRDRTGSAPPTGTFTAGTFTTKREDN